MLKQLFRSHFWIIVGLSALYSTYLIADIATQAVRLLLPPSAPYRLSHKHTSNMNDDVGSKLHARYALLNRDNLFDPNQKSIEPPKIVKKAKKVEPKDVVPTKACDPKGTYRPSNLPMALKGTSIASLSSYSVATIYDARRRKIVALRPGDIYRGVQICAIEKEEKPTNNPKNPKEKKYVFYVKLDRGQGRLEYLESGKGPGNGRERHITSMYNQFRKLRNTKVDLKGIRKTKTGQFSVKRSLINTLTNRLDWVGAQAAIVPYFKKGKAAGFRINHIRRNSLYTKLGLRNGDVIQRINGYVIDSPQRALEAYSNLTSASNISVDVVRKGKTKNISYEIKE